MRYILLLAASLALWKATYGQLSIDDEFMSSPTVAPTQNETDLFRINGVIILLTVGSCVFALLWLILFMYCALLCYGYHKKKNLEEKREGFYRQAGASPLRDTEMEFQFEQGLQTENEDEFRLPEENQAFSRTFSQESEHVTTFQKSSSKSRLMESTDGAGGRAAKKNKREEEEEEEESDSEESSEEDSEDESEEDSEEEDDDDEEEEGSGDSSDDSDEN